MFDLKYERIPRKEIRQRIARFQKLLQQHDIQGALISQNVDLFYFSGTIQRSYLFIPAQGKPLLAVQRDFERALRESPLEQIIPLKNNRQLGQILAEFGYSLRERIGLEMDVLPARLYLRLRRDFPEAEFVDVSELIKRVRMIKSDYEISQIRKACEILNQIMREAKMSIRPGMTELEVDGLLGGLARQLGHQGRLRMRGYNQEMFYAHVFCGQTATIPSSLEAPLGGLGTTPAIAQGASFNRIAENEPIIIDFCIGVNGYVSDVTRTFVIGKLPQRLEKAYDFAKEVKEFMEGWVRPGRRCSELYWKVMKLVEGRGYQDYFMGYKGRQVPFIGHGIGLEIDEYPLIAPNFHMEFEENMVFAFEPKLVFPGMGAVGVEDDYRVTKTGVERLSTYNDSLLTVVFGPER